MKNVAPNNVIIFFILILLGGCLIGKKQLNAKENKECYLLKIHSSFDKKMDSGAFYCLLETTKGKLEYELNRTYNTKYDFYDTLRYRLNAKCVLDYGEKYWQNSCEIGKLSYAKVSSTQDSIWNANLLLEMQNDSNYSFKFISIVKPLKTGLYVGVSRMKACEFCTVLTNLSLCILPEMDSIVILKNGF